MDNRHDVLYVTYDGLTDPLGQSQIIPYLAGLSKYGYKIHILSCEKKNRFIEQKPVIENVLRQSGIVWHPISYTRKPPVLSTIYDILRLKSYASKLSKEHKFSMVHCRSYIAAFVGLYLRRIAGVKFIFDMRGFWADERVDGNLWDLKNPLYRAIYRYFKKKERCFLVRSDFVVSLTENAKREIVNNFNLKEKTPQIEVIPCCADTRFFSRTSIDENKRNILSQQLGISPDDFVVSYSGSIGTWYMQDEMLDFFKRLQTVYSNAKLFFITHDEPEKIVRAASQKNIDVKKIIVAKATREQMPVMLSLSSIALFFIKPVYSKKASSPTKMGELMSMGIPFITNAGIGDVDDFVIKTGTALLVKNFTNTCYDDVIRNIPKLLMLDSGFIRDCAMAEYSLDYGISIYHKIYDRILGKY